MKTEIVLAKPTFARGEGKGEDWEGVCIPTSVVTEKIGVLGASGSGKSNLATVLVEEMHACGLPFVVIDPVGVWWGLRAGSDGDARGGLAGVVIFGGKHGDVPITREHGDVIADAVVNERISCVIDLSDFEDDDHRTTFLASFARRLYHRNEHPLHLVIEEADQICPEVPRKGEQDLVRAWTNIVRRGRARGLGCTLITQRSADLSKRVLTQVQTLFVLRTSGPQDVAAIAAWVKYYDTDAALLRSLAKLETGEAWVWSPQFLNRVERFHALRRRTFDSGATPKHGAPVGAQLARVDLEKLRGSLRSVIAEKEATDPALLRARIAELEKRLAERANAEPERVEVPVLSQADFEELRRIEKSLTAAATDAREVVGRITDAAHHRAARAEPAKIAVIAGSKPSVEHAPVGNHLLAEVGERVLFVPMPSPAPATGKTATLKKGARTMLAVLAAFHPRHLTRVQLATQAGFAMSGTFDSYVSALRVGGFVVEHSDGFGLTFDGKKLAGTPPRTPTVDEVVAMWKRRLKAGACRMLDVVLAHRAGVDRETLAQRAALTVSGTFDSYLSSLHSNNLVEKAQNGRIIRPHPSLFAGGG